MEKEATTLSLSANWMTLTARILSVIWAGCWTLFMAVYLISAIGKPIGPDGLKGFAVIAGGLVIVIVPTWLAWRKARVGGMVLVAEGLIIFAAYLIWPPGRVPAGDLYLTALLLGGPPVAAGVLFLVSQLQASASAADGLEPR